MRYSRAFIPTLREVPAEAELISHRLLLRAGFMRKLASGIYSWLPMGNRVVRKVANIVREENNAVGGQELLLPALHPKELWDETGRSAVDVIFHLKDRSERDLVLGMTHEEIVTDIIRSEIRSYRQLPLKLYQIQTKFRDEPRPRGGVVRGREFMMHDCYSFHTNQESLDETYREMYVCYGRILKRLGLDFQAVEAEAGAIGGSVNHEFMVVVDSGEDTILLCDSCGYAANAEKAGVGAIDETASADADILKYIDTPNRCTIEEVSDFLGLAAQKMIKTLIYEDEHGKVIAALIRGDRDLNEYKLAAASGSKLKLANSQTVEKVTGAPVGFAGPHGLNDVRIIASQELQSGSNWIAGANKPDQHVVNLNIGRDFNVDEWADLIVAENGDPCPRCGGMLQAKNGIEAGHIFKLGTKYSSAMGAMYLDQHGKDHAVLMGTYGFGITRIVGAIAEQYANADGIIWPASVAPFDVALLCLNIDDDSEIADRLYGELQSQNLTVLYDDRDERAGVKFKDADLIGIPIQVVVGRGAKTGKVEFRVLTTGDKRELDFEIAASEAARVHRELLSHLSRQADTISCPL